MPTQLPQEIIDRIIVNVLPWKNQLVAYPPEHEVTTTLLALALTCRQTYPVAMETLVAHCLYFREWSALLSSLILLEKAEGADEDDTLPKVNLLSHIDSLVLDLPETYGTEGLSLQDVIPTARLAAWVRRIFVRVPWYSHFGYFRELMKCFQRLEESVWGSLQFEDQYFGYWRSPTLKRSATLCYPQDPRDGSSFTWSRRVFPDNLQHHIVVGRTTNYDSNLGDSNGFPCANVQEPFRIVFATTSERVDENILLSDSHKAKEKENVDVLRYDIPTSYYGDEDEMELCSDWAWNAAMRGTIWKWGEPITSPPPLIDAPHSQSLQSTDDESDDTQ